MNNETIARFWGKVKKSKTCWVWTASKRNKGYGAFVWADENGRVIQGRAHRFSFELVNGPIQSGLCVLHKCDNPACVNPQHLFLGTRKDNNHDMIAKGRSRRGGSKCGGSGKWKRGEQHHGAKLNAQTVVDIRDSRGEGMSYSQLAKKFNIGMTTAWKIVNMKTWKHIQEENTGRGSV